MAAPREGGRRENCGNGEISDPFWEWIWYVPGEELGTYGDVEDGESSGEGFHMGAGERRERLAV